MTEKKRYILAYKLIQQTIHNIENNRKSLNKYAQQQVSFPPPASQILGPSGRPYQPPTPSAPSQQPQQGQPSQPSPNRPADFSDIQQEVGQMIQQFTPGQLQQQPGKQQGKQQRQFSTKPQSISDIQINIDQNAIKLLSSLSKITLALNNPQIQNILPDLNFQKELNVLGKSIQEITGISLKQLVNNPSAQKIAARRLSLIMNPSVIQSIGQINSRQLRVEFKSNPALQSLANISENAKKLYETLERTNGNIPQNDLQRYISQIVQELQQKSNLVSNLNQTIQQTGNAMSKTMQQIEKKKEKYKEFSSEIANKLMILEQNPYQKVRITDPKTNYQFEAEIIKYNPGQQIILKTDEGRNMVLKFTDPKFEDYIEGMQLQKMGLGNVFKSMLRQKTEGTPIGKAYNWLAPVFRGAKLKEKKELIKLAYSLDVLGLEKEAKEIDKIVNYHLT